MTMTLQIHATLDYALCGPTDIILQIEAAHLPEQSVSDAALELGPYDHFARVAGEDGIGERVMLRAHERLTADYRATVEIRRMIADVAALEAVPPHLLPGETVHYLVDSRYCPAESFRSFVHEQFGDLAGGPLIAAQRDYIHDRFRYVSGASDTTTTALETFVKRQGVCRDFAHMLITLARASGIPARIASVYAPDVQPQDFHAVAEVFLDGAWHLVDPTGMAREAEMAKIGVGRDAADIAFLTTFGAVTMNAQTVEVTMV